MKTRTRLSALLLVASVPAAGFAQSTMAPLLTRAWDNDRSGWNRHETVLTQASVKSRGLVRATIIPVYGDARGIESQPLILPSVTLADGSTHDVMVLPSMANVVRGVDATTGAALWQTPPLGTPIPLGSVQWSWSACTINELAAAAGGGTTPSWSLQCGTGSGNSAGAVSGYPQWASGTGSGGCSVSNLANCQ